MSLLRSLFRKKPINHAAKSAGRILLPRGTFKKIERKLPLVDPFEIKLPDGQVIHFEPFGDICSKSLRFDGWNGYETPSVELFHALARHAKVTFDIGAYLGYFGLLAAAAHPEARAYAFEAVPQLGRFAQQIVARNPHLKIELVIAAVSDHSGKITLYLPEDPLDSDTSTAADHRLGRTPIDVPAISVDDFVRQRNIDRVDLMKIDTETTEPAVLAGAADTIGRHRPMFICEVLPTANVAALEEFRRKNNYACARIRREGPFSASQIIPDPAQKDLNYIFYPQNDITPLTEELRRRLRN